MGHNPLPPYSPPTRETFHLANAKSAYVLGDLTLEEYEESVEHVLRGGYLNIHSRPAQKDSVVALPPGPENLVRRW